MKINLIVARARNGVIGINQEIPWHITQDFHNFKRLTFGHAVVMGRKTYESLPRPLAGRINIVVTSSPETIPTTDITIGVTSLVEAIELSNKLHKKELWIIGGERVYKEALPLVDELHITEVDCVVPYTEDSTVAKFDYEICPIEWELIEYRACSSETISFAFKVWQRRNK